MKLLLLTAALGLTACQSVPRSSALPPGGITHTVVFWLKDHGNAAQRAKIIETSLGFRQIPGVLSVTAGPCIPGSRPIVDSTFDVAVTLTFASMADLKGYLEHPIHKAASEGVLKPLAKKVTVYDFGG